jgi:Ca2+-dependent lipid-binding protein
MATKKNMSISISPEIFDWLKNQDINVSEYIHKFLEKEYEERTNPIIKIKKYEEERTIVEGKLEFYYQKLQKVVEDGNKQEREEASKLKEEKELKEKEYQESFISLLDSLRPHKDWIELVDSFDNLTPQEIISYNEIFNDSGIETGGWGRLKELLLVFSKEQLKGGLIKNG